MSSTYIIDRLNTVLLMNRVNVRLVPRELNLLQKGSQLEVAKEKLDNITEDRTFIIRIITGHETRVYEYDIETV